MIAASEHTRLPTNLKVISLRFGIQTNVRRGFYRLATVQNVSHIR